MKKFIALLLFSTTIHAAPFATGNADSGKKLFAKNNCNRCHVQIIGGDGNGIFSRPDHTVQTPSQLIDQLTMCGGNAGVNLSEQDKQDLGAYLNQRYYKFK